MRNTTLFLFLALGFFATSCASDSGAQAKESAQADMQTAEYDYQEQKQAQAKTDDLVIQERKIIRTASMRFQVDDLKSSSKRIEAMTKELGGFIANSQQRSSNYSIQNDISIRIPSERFDEFLARVEQEALYINHKNVNANDVTEEYVDITTRLKTKKEVRDRYIEILRDKAVTVEEVLNAEEKIRILQEEIEAAEGRLKYLSDRTNLSTIDLNLYQKVPYASAPKLYERGYFSRLTEGFWNGWEMIQSISIGIVTIWPIWCLLIAFFFVRRRFFSKKSE